MIFRGLEKELQGRVVNNYDSNGLFELPPLSVDGMPTSVDEMNQVHNSFVIITLIEFFRRFLLEGKNLALSM